MHFSFDEFKLVLSVLTQTITTECIASAIVCTLSRRKIIFKNKHFHRFRMFLWCVRAFFFFSIFFKQLLQFYE